MSIVTAMFATCNIFLVQFRQIPLLASDFSIIRTAMNVASDFSYHIGKTLHNHYVQQQVCFLLQWIFEKNT